jgi:hypothetical protein
MMPKLIGSVCGCTEDLTDVPTSSPSTVGNPTNEAESESTGSRNNTADTATEDDGGIGSSDQPLAPILSFNGMPQNKINTLSYLPIASGTLSVLGSLMILLSLYRSKVQLNQRASRQLRGRGRRGGNSRSAAQSPVYCRLLAAMSVYDIIMTFFSSMIGLLLGTGTSSNDKREGTQFDCTLQGFLFQWGFGSFAYGAWLNVYYVLTIRYNVRLEHLVKFFEPAAHISVFVIYFSTALIASLLDLMNPVSVSTCWIAPYPIYCAQFDFIPCQRGADYREAILFMIMIPSCVSVGVILVSLGLVAHTVWQQHRASRKYQLRIEDSSSYRHRRDGEGALALRSTSDPLRLVGESDETFVLPERQLQLPSSSRHVVCSARAKNSSPKLDNLAKEAILQCLVSGSTFVFTTVIWSTVGYGLLLSHNLLGGEGVRLISDLYWVSCA